MSFDNFKNLIKLYVPLNFSFKCYDCGDCCRHESGYVFLLSSELKTISNFFNLKEDEFKKLYAFQFSNNVYSLKEKQNYDCIFWDSSNRNSKGGCSIYKIRPAQCKNFPFWLTTFANKESFDSQAQRCKGLMSKKGKIYKEIEVYKFVYQDLKQRMIHYKSYLSEEIIKILFN
ncbi:MAG: YkgJ family cysteine cluster protein [Exilispira sp.]